MEHEHPYNEFENTPLWKIVEEAISDLESNQDLDLTTSPEYFIGYICRSLVNKGVSTDLSRH